MTPADKSGVLQRRIRRLGAGLVPARRPQRLALPDDGAFSCCSYGGVVQMWHRGVALGRVRFKAMLAWFVLAGGTMGRQRVSPATRTAATTTTVMTPMSSDDVRSLSTLSAMYTAHATSIDMHTTQATSSPAMMPVLRVVRVCRHEALRISRRPSGRWRTRRCTAPMDLHVARHRQRAPETCRHPGRSTRSG
jgi:hypothetical protein